VRESLVNLGDRVLDAFQSFLNPEILVVPRQHIELLPLDHDGQFGKEAVVVAVKCIQSNGRFMPRDDAEDNLDYVQIVPCGLLEFEDRVFLFERTDTDPKYRLFGKTTILQGCHASKRLDERIPGLLEDALLERVSSSLFLSRVFPIEAVGYCWDKDDEISSRHFGMVYRIQIDNPHTAVDLRKKEFRKQRGHGLSGQFVAWNDLFHQDVQTSLETWSHAILRGTRKNK